MSGLDVAVFVGVALIVLIVFVRMDREIFGREDDADSE